MQYVRVQRVMNAKEKEKEKAIKKGERGRRKNPNRSGAEKLQRFQWIHNTLHALRKQVAKIVWRAIAFSKPNATTSESVCVAEKKRQELE